MIQFLGLVASIIAIIGFIWQFKWIRQKFNELGIGIKGFYKKLHVTSRNKKTTRIEFPLPKKKIRK